MEASQRVRKEPFRLLATGDVHPQGPCPTTVVVMHFHRPLSPMSLWVTLFFWVLVSGLSGNRSPGLSCPELEAGLSL